MNRFGQFRVLIDIVGGVGLAMALLLVFFVDLLSRPSKLYVRVFDSRSESQKIDRRQTLRLAVTPTQQELDPKTQETILWDDMGKMLREMGEGYQDFKVIEPNTFGDNPSPLDDIDVLFLTCARGDGEGKEVKEALVRFVERGGTLYASDWRFKAINEAFPEFVDADTVGEGDKQEVTADVVDPGLRDFIGPTILLNFDMPRWKTAAFAKSKVTTLVRGKCKFYKNNQRNPRDRVGVLAEVPLLVKFKVGDGTVIFTSFHNEKQNSDTQKNLLHYLVFTLVVADIDAKVTASNQSAGFAPQKSNLLQRPDKESQHRADV